MYKTPGESNEVFFIWWRYLCYGVKMIKEQKIQPGSSKSVEPANSSSFISFCLMLGVTFLSFWGGCRHQWENSIKPTGKLRKIFFPHQSRMNLFYLCVHFLFTFIIYFHFTLWARLWSIHQISAKKEVDWLNTSKPAATSRHSETLRYWVMTSNGTKAICDMV